MQFTKSLLPPWVFRDEPYGATAFRKNKRAIEDSVLFTADSVRGERLVFWPLEPRGCSKTAAPG